MTQFASLTVNSFHFILLLIEANLIMGTQQLPFGAILTLGVLSGAQITAPDEWRAGVASAVISPLQP